MTFSAFLLLFYCCYYYIDELFRVRVPRIRRPELQFQDLVALSWAIMAARTGFKSGAAVGQRERRTRGGK